MDQPICAGCNGPMSNRRRDAVYCSRACKERARRARFAAPPLPSSLGCACCGEKFKPTASAHRYCSAACRDRAKWRRRVATPEARERYNARERAAYVPTPRRSRPACSVEGCEVKREARGMCMRHYRAARRAEGVEWAIGGDHKRRAARYGVAYEPINRLRVFERDGWVCGICGDPVVREDASLDHIVPMSLGGPHLYSNVQCSHLLCNVRKAASLPEEAVATP